MLGYEDLVDWCNKMVIPRNRQTAVSVNLYEVPSPNQAAEAAWVGTLSPSTPSAPETFELEGSLRPLKEKYGEVRLHIVIDLSNLTASATIRGHRINPAWHNDNPVILFNLQSDYHGDAVISAKVEILSKPSPVGNMLYPIILGPTYTYHPPTP